LFLADGQTDMTKLIVALRNFANAPKIPSVVESSCDSNPKVIGGLRTCLKLVSDPWWARLYSTYKAQGVIPSPSSVSFGSVYLKPDGLSAFSDKSEVGHCAEPSESYPRIPTSF
jgi:hypothetical protein